MAQKFISLQRKSGSLAGHLLIATPVVQESCFARSVIYLCAHNIEGAMGMIINYPIENIGIKDILDQLDIHAQKQPRNLPIHFGGPVESNRGFILHSDEYTSEESLIRKGDIAVTSSVTVLRELAHGGGPQQGILVLGYAGWSPGQLEAEIEGGSWIVVPASKKLVFDTENGTKWNTALASLGIDMGHFSTVVGHA